MYETNIKLLIMHQILQFVLLNMQLLKSIVLKLITAIYWCPHPLIHCFPSLSRKYTTARGQVQKDLPLCALTCGFCCLLPTVVHAFSTRSLSWIHSGSWNRTWMPGTSASQSGRGQRKRISDIFDIVFCQKTPWRQPSLPPPPPQYTEESSGPASVIWRESDSGTPAPSCLN